VSRVLNQFALSVPGIVRKHNGRTIFAGGDDVLAFLPLETALKAADELRRLFFCKFAEWLENQRKEKPGELKLLALHAPTLSGSIVYAHHQAPLGAVLHAGHDLLTNLAKRQADRNALAMQQYMRGGSNLSFAAKWTDAQTPSLMDRLNAVIDQLKDREFSSAIFYQLRESGWMFAQDGPFGDLKDKKNNNKGRNDAAAYVSTLLGKSRLREKKESEEQRTLRLKTLASELLDMCLSAVVGSNVKGFAPEPLLMCRFLAGGGREAR